MQPSLPLPTDNIYKFVCLFGFALIVVATFSYASVYTASLNEKVKYSEAIVVLTAKAERTKVESDILELNQRLLKVTKNNEDFVGTTLSAVLGVGLALSALGAWHWHHKIQIRDDRMANLQLEKLELEIERLRSSHTKAWRRCRALER